MPVVEGKGDPLSLKCDLQCVPVSTITETEDPTYQALKAIHPQRVAEHQSRRSPGLQTSCDEFSDPNFKMVMLCCLSVKQKKGERFVPDNIDVNHLVGTCSQLGYKTMNVVLPGFGHTSLEGQEDTILTDTKDLFEEYLKEYGMSSQLEVRIFTPPHQ